LRKTPQQIAGSEEPLTARICIRRMEHWSARRHTLAGGYIKVASYR